MRIESVRAYAIDLPFLRGTYTMSGGRSASYFTTTVVQVECDSGITGFGECCTAGSNYLEGFPGGVRAAIQELAPIIVGLDPRETAVVNHVMDQAMAGQLAAKSAIDIACWDAKGRSLGESVTLLLGGCFHDSLPSFDAISMDTPERMADYARAMKEAGYTRYQLKLGADPRVDADRVRGITQSIGSWDFITCDANAHWTLPEAMQMIRMLDEFDVFVEQPCRTLAQVADVRSRTHLPILVDEVVTGVSALLDVIEARAADAINLKLTRVGGLTKARQIRDLAQLCGLRIVVDEPGGGDLAIAAMLGLAASTQQDYLLAVSGSGTSVHVAGNEAPVSVGGRLPVLTDPGLGITIDQQLLGRPFFAYPL